MQRKISKISADPKGCKKANLGEINLVHLNENSPARNWSQEEIVRSQEPE
ncbi:hypothetical protein [Oscillatoria nigro-viridis]|nr:hypothetical protein [Oscillatoria nigro-viridis]